MSLGHHFSIQGSNFCCRMLGAPRIDIERFQKSCPPREPIIWQQMLSCLPTTLAVDGVNNLKGGKTNPFRWSMPEHVYLNVCLTSKRHKNHREEIVPNRYMIFHFVFLVLDCKSKFTYSANTWTWFFFLGFALAPFSTQKQACWGASARGPNEKGLFFFGGFTHWVSFINLEGKVKSILFFNLKVISN